MPPDDISSPAFASLNLYHWPIAASTVGIDVGLKDLFVTDTGFKQSNPRHTAKYAARLALLQRRLSKKARGSKNRARARLKVARLYAKIADCRLDALHKATRKLINDNQVVCVESLKVNNMLRNPSLSKAIADASWSEFVRQLRYKGEWAGRSVVAIDPYFPSSKRCSCAVSPCKKCLLMFVNGTALNAAQTMTVTLTRPGI
ncbi:transposase, IS605 OrfB family [Raoultella ornithinolytica]|nr:transposase, IS605 OrfB family [Raoultella ornithinolytica]